MFLVLVAPEAGAMTPLCWILHEAGHEVAVAQRLDDVPSLVATHHPDAVLLPPNVSEIDIWVLRASLRPFGYSGRIVSIDESRLTHWQDALRGDPLSTGSDLGPRGQEWLDSIASAVPEMVGDDRDRIVCFDSDPEFLTILTLLLGDEGYGVATVNALPATIEDILALQPSLVILDLPYAYQAGEDLLERLHADDRIRRIPVIVTSLSYDVIDYATRRYGEFDNRLFLAKPLDLNDVLDGVRRFAGPRVR